MTPHGLIRLLAIVLLLVGCLPIYGIARLFGAQRYWVAFFLRNTGRLLGLKVTVAGTPSLGPVLYAANHSSWLDILALGGTRYTRFVAKSEIQGWPLVGWLARIGGAVFVSRERRSATRQQADEVLAALSGGDPVGLFAEGGTGDGITLSPFRPALFAAAVEAGAPVQPVAVDYGARSAEIAWPEGTSFATEMKRILNRHGVIPLTLHYCQPLDAALDRKELAARSHDAVADALRSPASALEA